MMITTVRTLGIVRANYTINHFIDVIKLHLNVNTVLTDNLDVVFLAVLTEQKSEAASPDVLPSVLLVKPV